MVFTLTCPESCKSGTHDVLGRKLPCCGLKQTDKYISSHGENLAFNV